MVIMIWWLPCVSSKIPAMCWENHHQMTFPWKNLCFISIHHEIAAVVHFNVNLQTYKQHQTNSLHIAGPLESPATCSYMQQDISSIERASWLSFIPLWLVAYNIFLRTFHFSLSSSSPFPQHEDMASQTPQPGVIESESGRTTGTSSYVPLADTQQ